eukprot:ANDGO_04512.mRNA.1 hypothetical protein
MSQVEYRVTNIEPLESNLFPFGSVGIRVLSNCGFVHSSVLDLASLRRFGLFEGCVFQLEQELPKDNFSLFYFSPTAKIRIVRESQRDLFPFPVHRDIHPSSTSLKSLRDAQETLELTSGTSTPPREPPLAKIRISSANFYSWDQTEVEMRKQPPAECIVWIPLRDFEDFPEEELVAQSLNKELHRRDLVDSDDGESPAGIVRISKSKETIRFPKKSSGLFLSTIGFKKKQHPKLLFSVASDFQSQPSRKVELQSRAKKYLQKVKQVIQTLSPTASVLAPATQMHPVSPFSPAPEAATIAADNSQLDASQMYCSQIASADFQEFPDANSDHVLVTQANSVVVAAAHGSSDVSQSSMELHDSSGEAEEAWEQNLKTSPIDDDVDSDSAEVDPFAFPISPANHHHRTAVQRRSLAENRKEDTSEEVDVFSDVISLPILSRTLTSSLRTMMTRVLPQDRNFSNDEDEIEIFTQQDSNDD